MIDGAGLITFDGGGSAPLFYVDTDADVTLSGLTLTRSTQAAYSAGTLTLADDAVVANSGMFSAVNSRGSLTVMRSLFADNTSSIGDGGALQAVGALVIEDSTFDENTAHSSGAVLVGLPGSPPATITRSTFTANGASLGGGGALTFEGTSLSIRESRFEGNHADFGQGGAIQSLGGALDIADSTFDGNLATSMFASGGAIYCGNGSLRIAGSTFSNNATGSFGGGAIHTGCDTDIENSTLTANTATGTGGAIAVSDGGGGTIAFATINANAAAVGAGIFGDSNGNALHVRASIVAANGTTNCGGGMIVSDGYNVSDDESCASFLTGTGDVLDADATLGALGDNGGPTATELPGEGSAAVDHVPLEACAPYLDQRGDARPSGAACDAGAVENGASPDRLFMDGFEG